MPERIALPIRVIARARADRVDGTRADRLVVRLRAAPLDGAANQAVREVIAGALGIRVTEVRIERGATTRDKTVSVPGGAAAAVARLLK